MLDVRLEECFGRSIVEGFDVGVDVTANTLERCDKSIKRERARVSVSSLGNWTEND